MRREAPLDILHLAAPCRNVPVTFALGISMRLELVRDAAKSFPVAEKPSETTSLCVWHCKYKTLAPLAEFKNLQELKIATFPDESFECLSSLSRLEWLSVLHLPKVKNLEALSRIKSLRFLALETLPSWDASRKRTVVESIAALSKLPKLEHISLLGIVPTDMSLIPLEQCKHLKSARFHGYPMQEIERFFQASKVENAHMPGDA